MLLLPLGNGSRQMDYYYGYLNCVELEMSPQFFPIPLISSCRVFQDEKFQMSSYPPLSCERQK